MSAIKVNPEKNHPKKDMGMGLETPLEPAWNAGINIQHPAMFVVKTKGSKVCAMNGWTKGWWKDDESKNCMKMKLMIRIFDDVELHWTEFESKVNQASILGDD